MGSSCCREDFRARSSGARRERVALRSRGGRSLSFGRDGSVVAAEEGVVVLVGALSGIAVGVVTVGVSVSVRGSEMATHLLRSDCR